MRGAVAVALALLAAAPGGAGADPEVSALGRARAISRAASADRDTPRLNLVVAPRDIRTAGGEVSLVTARFSTLTLRTGFAGLLELESDGETSGLGNLFPKADGAILWRGAYAYHVSVSFDATARRLCGTCALELTVGYRHESQHYTGSNQGGPGEDVSEQPQVGDAVIGDVAVAGSRGPIAGWARVAARGYLPGRSSYAALGAVEAHARYTGFGRWQPFVSTWLEGQLGTEAGARRYPDAYLARLFAGLAITSPSGEILVYAFGDVGHRKGIRMLDEEATAGLGIRLSLY